MQQLQWTDERVELLKKLKFVSDGPAGTLVINDSSEVDTSQAALAQKIYYEQMAELAAQSLYTQGPDTQDFESITLSLPQSKMTELRAKIHQWMVEMGATNATHNHGDAVYQLNIQLFALTRVPTTGVTTTTTATTTSTEQAA